MISERIVIPIILFFGVMVKSKILLFVFIQCTASLWGSKKLIDQLV